MAEESNALKGPVFGLRGRRGLPALGMAVGYRGWHVATISTTITTVLQKGSRGYYTHFRSLIYLAHKLAMKNGYQPHGLYRLYVPRILLLQRMDTIRAIPTNDTMVDTMVG